MTIRGAFSLHKKTHQNFYSLVKEILVVTAIKIGFKTSDALLNDSKLVLTIQLFPISRSSSCISQFFAAQKILDVSNKTDKKSHSLNSTKKNF